MFIKMRIRHCFRKKQTKSHTEQGIIYTTVTIHKKRSQPFSTGIQVLKSEWDAKKQQIIGRNKAILNDELTAISNALLSIKQSLQANKKDVTADAVRNQWLQEQAAPITIFSIMDQHEAHQRKHGRGKKGKPLTKGTFTFYSTNRAYFTDYINQHKNALVNPESINAIWLNRYETYLATRPIKPLKQRSINSAITYLKQILSYAMANELINKAPALHYKLKPAPTVLPMPLTDQECTILEFGTFTRAQQKVVDCFFFLRYTGLHYIDGKQLTDKAICTDEQGKRFLFLNRQKTEEPAYIPYHPKAEALVNKYGAIEKLPFTGFDNMTALLRKAAKSVGLNKKMTLGMARDTFANDCSNNMKMSDESLATMLGHTTTGQVKKYRRISIDRITKEWKA